MAFEDEDHSYGGPDSKGLPGDRFVVMRDFAKQIAAKGIKKVKGHVLVDISLFGEGDRELGTNVVISPIILNDNVVDVVVSPGAKDGEAAQISVEPKTSYVTINNKATTGKPGSKTSLLWDEKANIDGTQIATLTGSIAIDGKPIMYPYRVAEPSRFAEVALQESLKEAGVTATLPAYGAATDFKALASKYTEKILSPNTFLHRSRKKPRSHSKSARTCTRALGLTSSAQFSVKPPAISIKPASISSISSSPKLVSISPALRKATAPAATPSSLPISWFTTSRTWPSSRSTPTSTTHFPFSVKTARSQKSRSTRQPPATSMQKLEPMGPRTRSTKICMVTGKGLAGYMDTASGKHLILALYVNMVAVSLDDPDAIQKVPGEALGEIASAAYDSMPAA